MILLDTVAFLWIITNSPNLSRKAKRAYLDTRADIYLSSISLWEIVVKYNLGRLPLPKEPASYIPEQRRLHGVEPIVLTESDVAELQDLPKIHKDPFDRMLVCQAIARGLVILTPDKMIQDYPVKTLW